MLLVTLIAGLVAATGPPSASAPTAVRPCLLLGDSIAIGIARLRPACRLVAQKGITSDEVLAAAPADRSYRHVIVAMGSNDRWRTPLPRNLAAVRTLYPKASFTWIAPRRGRSAQQVAAFASSHHDGLVELVDFSSRDTVHPLDYAAVAARLP